MRVQTDRKQTELNHQNADHSHPDADAYAVLVAQTVEARHLARIHQQLQRTGKGNAQQHHEWDGGVHLEQPLGTGLARQVGDRANAAGRPGYEGEQEQRTDHHEHALHHIRSHHGKKAAHGGIANDHHERDADGHLVGNAEEHLQEVACALEDRYKIEQARERDDHGGGQPHALAGETRR